jgi:hypothetical protein
VAPPDPCPAVYVTRSGATRCCSHEAGHAGDHQVIHRGEGAVLGGSSFILQQWRDPPAAVPDPAVDRCRSLHPSAAYQCDRVAGHDGLHRVTADDDSRTLWWPDHVVHNFEHYDARTGDYLCGCGAYQTKLERLINGQKERAAL